MPAFPLILSLISSLILLLSRLLLGIVYELGNS
jgi:hypothetical protein